MVCAAYRNVRRKPFDLTVQLPFNPVMVFL